MAKEEGIKMDGIVQDVLPNAMFKVKLKTQTLWSLV
jgi:translation initiation factor IF-1